MSMSHESTEGQAIPSSKQYRFAWGEVATPAIIAQRVRLALLTEAEARYPQMRAEIEQMARRYRFEFMVEYWQLAEELQQQVVEFCRRWGLVEDRQPATWALDMVAGTWAQTSLLDRWIGWFLPAGAAISGGDYRPAVETLKDAKRRFPRRRWAELSAVIERALANGWQSVRTRWNPNPVEWAVRHQIGGETWGQIASEAIGPMRAPEYAYTVKMQARELLRLAGLSRPRGRPKR